jgi:carbohydrate kinase (thermoresistant glucokinase family)
MIVVIVIGAAATGKSTLGKALADALGCPFVEGDDFHPESNRVLMAAGVALGDQERAPWLAALAHSIGERVRAGTPAVYACSALKRRYRAALLAEDTAPLAVRFVYLQASRAVLAERLARRQGHFFPVSLLDSQLNDLEPPGDNEPAPTLTVDATHSVDALVAQTLDWLGAARDN